MTVPYIKNGKLVWNWFCYEQLAEHRTRLANIRLTEKGARDKRFVDWMFSRLESGQMVQVPPKAFDDLIARRFETVT